MKLIFCIHPICINYSLHTCRQAVEIAELVNAEIVTRLCSGIPERLSSHPLLKLFLKLMFHKEPDSLYRI